MVEEKNQKDYLLRPLKKNHLNIVFLRKIKLVAIDIYEDMYSVHWIRTRKMYREARKVEKPVFSLKQK